jgi:flagellar hook assembly protein FlgD
VGTSLTVRAILPSPFSTAVSGIGGGPLLVKNGKAVFRSNESFGSPWLIQRTARTAVGQRADGGILLVVVEGGRPGSSVGMTNFELAQTMAGLGAVTAMGLDSGANSTMAVEGSLLSRPSQGEKPIGSALALLYSGVYAPLVDDFGSGGKDGTSLAYKLVRPSTVSAVLDGPGSAHVSVDAGQKTAGAYSFGWKGVDSGGRGLPEGRWTWRVTATDDQGRRSETERPFSFNTTLRGLAVEPGVLRKGSSVRITLDLDRPATVSVQIERGGVVLRTLVKRQADTGKTTVSWNGRIAGRLASSKGTYIVRATAVNQVGTAELTATVRQARR